MRRTIQVEAPVFTVKQARADIETAIGIAGRDAKTSGTSGRRITYRGTLYERASERQFLAMTVYLARMAMEHRATLRLRPR